MDVNEKLAETIARGYLHAQDPLTKLGSGLTGYVFLSPNGQTAVKVHHREESFIHEVRMYQWLGARAIGPVQGLEIPKMRNYSKDHCLIHMDYVSPPFLVDFAGTQFKPTDFPPEVLEDWYAMIDRRFGPNAWVVYKVKDALEKHGIYYLDFQPRNLNVKGLPGTVPYEPTEDDDDF